MMKFKSVFAGYLFDYVKLKRGLGLKFKSQTKILRTFDCYVCESGCNSPLLTQELAINFVTSSQASKDLCARRYEVIRHFSDYLAIFEPETPRLDSSLLRRPQQRTAQYIYTEEELVQLLHEAKNISERNPIRGITLHAMVGLGASTGMRISEVVRLNKSDVDLETGVLVVRRTKFFKDRLVPVHPTTLDVLRKYAADRDIIFPNVTCPAFFINMSRRRYSAHTLQLAFWELTLRIGLRGCTGTGPSFHSMRHSFAVRRLITWYKEGIDVQAMLPALATYLGHVHYRHTAYYLTATAELLELAVKQYQRNSHYE